MLQITLRTLALALVLALTMSTASLAFGEVQFPRLQWPECGAFGTAECVAPNADAEVTK